MLGLLRSFALCFTNKPSLYPPLCRLQDCYDECLRYQDSIGKFDRLLYKAAHQPDVDEVQVLAALKELLGVQLDRVLATVR